MPFLKNAFESKYFRKFYPAERLDYDRYAAENRCPLNEKLCNEEAVWLPQNVLLGSKNDINHIAHAIEKVVTHAEAIKKKLQS
jgi:hypothetical protein